MNERHDAPTDLDLRFAYAVNDVYDMAYEPPECPQMMEPE